MTATWHADETQADSTFAGSPVPTAQSDDFVDLYRSHYPRLVSALRLTGASPAHAQDAAQEAFARTFRRWRRVRAGTNPAGYVTTVAFRLLRRGKDLSDGPALLDTDATVAAHDTLVVARADVEACLATMPVRRRACAALCLYLDVSVEDAAAALGIAPATIRVQLHRARDELRAALGEPVTD